MFVVVLKFAGNRAAAPEHMAAHKQWIADGREAGVFLLVGSLKPSAGGVLLAHGEDRAALEARVAADPFVEHGVVSAEILEIAPAQSDERLAFLMSEAA